MFCQLYASRYASFIISVDFGTSTSMTCTRSYSKTFYSLKQVEMLMAALLVYVLVCSSIDAHKIVCESGTKPGNLGARRKLCYRACCKCCRRTRFVGPNCFFHRGCFRKHQSCSGAKGHVGNGATEHAANAFRNPGLGVVLLNTSEMVLQSTLPKM